MRRSAAASITGPTSLSTSRRKPNPGWAASAMPIRPPMLVPTQSMASSAGSALPVAAAWLARRCANSSARSAA